MREFNLPDLGEGLESAEILEWLIEPGDAVALNQDLCVVETAKASVTIPSPFEGVLVDRFGEAGEEVRVGALLVRISSMGDHAADTPTAAPKQPANGGRKSVLVGYGTDDSPQAGRRRRRQKGAPAVVEATPAIVAAPDVEAVEAPAGRPNAKPPVRHLAKQLGVDISAVIGTGAEGQITREDVQDAAAGTSPTALATGARSAGGEAPQGGGIGFRGRYPGEVIPLRGVRKRIAERVTLSRSTIPDATAHLTVDCTALWAASRHLTEEAQVLRPGVRISPFVLGVRAAIVALRRFPTFNARIDEEQGEIRLLEQINIGIAADTERGLVVPVIRDTQDLSTLELAESVSSIIAAARDGSLTPNQLVGGTFTVNNYGAIGSDSGDPVINHPEAAILGIGSMRMRPWVVGDDVVPRRVTTLTVAFDHRVCDGGEAGRFLSFLGGAFEEPTGLLLHL